MHGKAWRLTQTQGIFDNLRLGIALNILLHDHCFDLHIIQSESTDIYNCIPVLHSRGTQGKKTRNVYLIAGLFP